MEGKEFKVESGQYEGVEKYLKERKMNENKTI